MTRNYNCGKKKYWSLYWLISPPNWLITIPINLWSLYALAADLLGLSPIHFFNCLTCFRGFTRLEPIPACTDNEKGSLWTGEGSSTLRQNCLLDGPRALETHVLNPPPTPFQHWISWICVRNFPEQTIHHFQHALSSIYLNIIPSPTWPLAL